MRYYFCKIVMIFSFVTATLCYFDKVFEIAIYFMLGTILFQLLSMEWKEVKTVTKNITFDNHLDSDKIGKELHDSIIKKMAKNRSNLL